MRSKIVHVLIVLAALVFAAYVVHATQAELSKPPAITETQKLQIQNVLQRIQIAQLQSQAAQAEFERARADAEALFKSLSVPGYDLNLQTYQYQKKAK